jgi:hypothetical protein
VKITNLTKTPQIERLNVKKGLLGGMIVPEKDYIVFSDWTKSDEAAGRIQYFDMKTELTKSLPFQRAFDAPSDFYFDELQSCFYIPCTHENKVFIQQMDGILSEVEIMD